MSLVSSKCLRSLSLLSRFVFQEGLLISLSVPTFTGWHRSWMLNSMLRWLLKIITLRTHQSPILQARRGAAIVRSIITPPPRSSSERKIPAPIQYNQVISSDHLTDQYSPSIQTGFSPLGRLTTKVARNKGAPTSLSKVFLKEEDLSLEDLERIVGRKVAAAHTYPCHLHPDEPRVGLQKILKSRLFFFNWIFLELIIF